MASSGMLRGVALVRTEVSEELSASFIRVTRIGVLGTTLAVIAIDAHLICHILHDALIHDYVSFDVLIFLQLIFVFHIST
jgi:hypothetical protein